MFFKFLHNDLIKKKRKLELSMHCIYSYNMTTSSKQFLMHGDVYKTRNEDVTILFLLHILFIPFMLAYLHMINILFNFFPILNFISFIKSFCCLLVHDKKDACIDYWENKLKLNGEFFHFIYFMHFTVCIAVNQVLSITDLF